MELPKERIWMVQWCLNIAFILLTSVLLMENKRLESVVDDMIIIMDHNYESVAELETRSWWNQGQIMDLKAIHAQQRLDSYSTPDPAELEGGLETLGAMVERLDDRLVDIEYEVDKLDSTVSNIETDQIHHGLDRDAHHRHH